jgi:hypothetical protein
LQYKWRKAGLFHLSLSLDYLLRRVFLDYAYGGLGDQIYSKYDVDIHSVNFRFLPGLKLGESSGRYINAGFCNRPDGAGAGLQQGAEQYRERSI